MSQTTRIITRARWSAAAGLVLLAGLGVVGAGAASQKFYPDDPMSVIVDAGDASGVARVEIDLYTDTLENLFSWPGDRTLNVRAQNLNTIDEVPDSSWFTNRLGTRPITVDELLKGPDTGTGPAAGPWTIVAAKSDGVTPGFTVRDSNGQLWFIKLDPPGYRAMATGTEVVVTKLMWALGYHVPEVYLATLLPDQLTIGETATIRPINGQKRRLKQSDINALLRRADRGPDGSFRVIASKSLEGRPIGGFQFFGRRTDDPNDLVAHEHRRELRAYGTFAAWLNHVDSKSINTLDTLVDEGGRKTVHHHLLDFGSTIGSAGVYPREAFEGSEYLVEGKKTLAGIPTFGFYLKDWRTTPQYRSRTVGSFPIDNSNWDPETWKPRYANSAFRSARLDDKFWAARRLQLFTDEMLKAVTSVGQFNDSASEAALAKFLIDRRDAIVRRYLPAVNPVVDVKLADNGPLTFTNAAVDADLANAPFEYIVSWRRFDNTTGGITSIGLTMSAGTRPSVPAPADLPSAEGTYIRAEIAALGGPESWRVPAHAYFVRRNGGWNLVGFERVPDGNPPKSDNARTETTQSSTGIRAATAGR